MDVIKTGKYIAGKRKEAGLTQKQLAEKLSMSDKSVSKWERGVCLPDVSVYMELCGILGISINEFFAGEDISEENIAESADNNLIRVAEYGKHKQKNLKIIIAAISIVALAAIVLLGVVLLHNLNRPQNYITPFERDSVEMKTAKLLSPGLDDAMLFKYFTDGEYKSLRMYMSEYRSGELVSKTKVSELSYEDIGSASEGIIALVPDFEQFEIKLIIADSYAKSSTAVPVLEGAEGREYYMRSAVQIENELPIQYNSEQSFAAFIYGKDGVSTVPIGEPAATDNDYVYCFSFEFCK